MKKKKNKKSHNVLCVGSHLPIFSTQDLGDKSDREKLYDCVLRATLQKLMENRDFVVEECNKVRLSKTMRLQAAYLCGINYSPHRNPFKKTQYESFVAKTMNKVFCIELRRRHLKRKNFIDQEDEEDMNLFKPTMDVKTNNDTENTTDEDEKKTNKNNKMRHKKHKKNNNVFSM